MDLQDSQPALGDIPLYLASATKSVEMTPNGIAIGLIRLRGWQVYRLTPLPSGFEGHAGYLVKANYEFDIAPDVPAPAWAEVEFGFHGPGAVVIDAAPRAISTPVSASRYLLDDQLNFICHESPGTRWPPGLSAAAIALPPLTPQISCFGLGGDLVRWRHTQTVPAGTQTGWFVLLLPPDSDEVAVVASGRYHVDTDPALRLRPMGRADAFTVRLPAAMESSHEIGCSHGGAEALRSGAPRVFVSYAHESLAHERAVTQLCRLLEENGVDVRFDQKDEDTRRNWDKWIITQILRSDFVIVIASPDYRAAGNGELPDDQPRGVLSEYHLLADLLFRDNAEWTRKILPVVLPGRSEREIPLRFLPGTGTFYPVGSIDREGAKCLFRVLLPGQFLDDMPRPANRLE